MKLAITSEGPSLDSRLDERFGRARYVLIVDTEKGLLESIDNCSNLNAAQGAGINAAQMIADKGVQWLLTGHIGPKAFQVLERVGISTQTDMKGLCLDAVEKFKKGECAKAVGPNAISHW